jgi:transposase
VKKPRKHYTGEEKVAILRRHLLEQEPVSKLCDELGLQPTVFYRWQKEFFENGAAAFQAKGRSDHQAEGPNLWRAELVRGAGFQPADPLSSGSSRPQGRLRSGLTAPRGRTPNCRRGPRDHPRAAGEGAACAAISPDARR